MTAETIAEEQPLPPSAETSQTDIEALRSKATELERQARALIQERPVVAVLAAVGLGYLVARLVSRGSR